jgi:hypothetical protein
MVAGTIALILLLGLATVVYDESPWKLLRMMAAVVLGPRALQPDDEFNFVLVSTGVLVHFALALLYAFALATLVQDLPEGAAPWLGLAFGVALYYANLYGFAQLFPWFVPMRTLDTLGAHVLLGIVAATAYRQLAGPNRAEALAFS